MAYKQFLPAQVLTASEAQTYLMNQSVIVFANAAARTTALTAPTEGMFTYLQDTDELQVYNGSSWLTLVVTSDDESFVTTGSVTAANGGQDGGIALRTWTGGSGYVGLATRDMASAEYMMISDGTDTFISAGSSGNVNIRGGNNSTTNALQINSTNANFAGTVSIGSDSVVSANTSSQLHVRKDTAGGKGAEISLVNYATNTVGNSAALNFAVDQSTYGSDNGNAQIRATNQVLANAATELGFYTWNGSAWKKRWYIDSGGLPRANMSQFQTIDGQYHGTSGLLQYNLKPSLGSYSSNGAWVTIGSGAIDGATAGVNYPWFEYRFTAYVTAGGSFYTRVLTQPASGGSYVSNQVYHFRNNTYDHFHVGWADISYINKEYCNYFVQFYGNGITIQTDANDSLAVTIWSA